MDVRGELRCAEVKGQGRNNKCKARAIIKTIINNENCD